MNKADRQKIFEKYGGLCAYTGKPLGEDWQVDHILCKMETFRKQKNRDDINNMVPCLKIVNHYKRGLLFVEWRRRVSVLHIRLTKLPKNTRVAKSQKTKDYLLKVAEAFDITVDKPFNGLFYFETLNTQGGAV